MFQRNVPVSFSFTSWDGEVFEVEGVATCEVEPHPCSRLPCVTDAWLTSAVVDNQVLTASELHVFANQYADAYLEELVCQANSAPILRS